METETKKSVRKKENQEHMESGQVKRWQPVVIISQILWKSRNDNWVYQEWTFLVTLA